MTLGQGDSLAQYEIVAPLAAGRYDDAVKTFDRAVVLSERGTYYVSWLGWGHAIAGRRDEAAKILDELSARTRFEYVAPLCVAQIYSGLEWWRKAIEANNDAAAISARLSLRPLAADPRGRSE